MHIILIIFGFFLVGYIARRFISEPTSLVKRVNLFIIYVCLPSIILLKVPHLEFSKQVLIPAVAAWVWLLVGVVLVLSLSRYLQWAKPTEGALLLLVTMGNSSFLGYPMVLAFFDDAVLAYAIFFDQLGSFIILSTYGFIIVAMYSTQSDRAKKAISLISMGKQIFTFPPFISLLVALMLPIDGLVTLIKPALDVFALVLMPAALLVLGLQFQPKLLPEHKRPLVIGICLKIMVAPLVATLVVILLNGSIDVRNATVFESAMPSMITPGLMAIAAGIAPRFVATMLGYCTLAGFITLPIVATLLT